MTLFAVEIDYYLEGASKGAILVPRTAFVPSWITGPAAAVRSGARTKPNLADVSPEFRELVARMDEIATEMGLQVRQRRTGWSYLPPVLEEGVHYATAGVGVYASGRGVEINYSVLRDLGHAEVADELLARLEAVSGTSVRHSRNWPAVPCASLLQDWARTCAEVIEPYFRARMESAMPPPIGPDDPVS